MNGPFREIEEARFASGVNPYAIPRSAAEPPWEALLMSDSLTTELPFPALRPAEERAPLPKGNWTLQRSQRPAG